MATKLYAAVRREQSPGRAIVGDCDEWVDIFPVLSDAVRAAEEWVTLDGGDTANIRIFVAEGFASGEYGEDLLVLRSAK